MYVYIYIYMYIHIYIFIHIHIQVYIHMYVYISTHMHVYIYSIYIYIYIYIYAYIHTYKSILVFNIFTGELYSNLHRGSHRKENVLCKKTCSYKFSKIHRNYFLKQYFNICFFNDLFIFPPRYVKVIRSWCL